MKKMFHGISWLLPSSLANWLLRRSTRLAEFFFSADPDKFMEHLLEAMSLAFCLCRGFRRNLLNFRAQYVFATTEGSVCASASFADGKMAVGKEGLDSYTVKVAFTDTSALRSFLFSSQKQDILSSLLRNEVSLDGNLNYVYKFGFLVRDLMHRLKIEL
jgi:hypothetical protein